MMSRCSPTKVIACSTSNRRVLDDGQLNRVALGLVGAAMTCSRSSRN
jgi:hypothetical protein